MGIIHTLNQIVHFIIIINDRATKLEKLSHRNFREDWFAIPLNILYANPESIAITVETTTTTFATIMKVRTVILCIILTLCG